MKFNKLCWSGWNTGPCRPWGRRQGPVARWGGDRPPSFFFSRDFVANLKKKNYIWALSPPHRATVVYFWNFPKPTYIFEILFFLNIKKKKPPVSPSEKKKYMARSKVGLCSILVSSIILPPRQALMMHSQRLRLCHVSRNHNIFDLN